MKEAYFLAHTVIISVLQDGGNCLDCGANNEYKYDFLRQAIGLEEYFYYGVEWNAAAVKAAHGKGLNVIQGDLARAC
jgi:hypothetical protein